jgi:beta-glucanase (GH16 family)
MRSAKLPALAAGMIAAAAVCAAPPGYRLVFSDEFDGAALDMAKWEHRQLGDREGTQVSKDSVALDGKGNLVLSTMLQNGLLHVGMIGTQRTFQARYGFFEARIRFQRLQGHHGAFWLQSPLYGKHLDDPGRSGAEIDVIEYFGSGRSDGGAAVNVYWNPYPKPKNARMQLAVARPHEEFHVYAVHWTAQGYEFLVDGKPVFSTKEGLSHACQYMILSLLSSPWERRRLPVAALPDAMRVDYVRVYADPGRAGDCPAGGR